MTRRQQGIALLSAVVTAAIVTAVAVAMASSQYYNRQRTDQLLLRDRARLAFAELASWISDDLTDYVGRLSAAGEGPGLSLTDDSDAAYSTERFGEDLPPNWVFTGEARFEDGSFASYDVESVSAFFNINNIAERLDGSGVEMLGGGPARGQTGTPPAGDAAAAASTPGATAGPSPEQLPGNRPGFADGKPLRRLTAEEASDKYAFDFQAAGQPLPFAEPDIDPDPFLPEGQQPDGGAGQGSANRPGQPGSGALKISEDVARDLAGALPGATEVGQLLAAQGGGSAVPRSLIETLRLRLLLKALDIDPGIVQALQDWLDGDAETRFPNGAEDDYYLNLPTPYRAANAPFADISELRLVRGVTPEIYDKLAPYLSVLPVAGDIDVNSAPVEVLMSLGPFLTRDIAEGIVSRREIQRFESVASFTAEPLVAERLLAGADGIAVTSRFFRVKAALELPGRRYNVIAVMAGDPGQGFRPYRIERFVSDGN